MAKVVVAGATGTIGRALIGALVRRGDAVTALSRNPPMTDGLPDGVRVVAWPEPKHTPPPEDALSDADVVVNLLGEPIAQRWSEEVKREIKDSRVLGTRSLVQGIEALPGDRRPRVLVSQSATGFYGARGGEPLEEDATPGTDFLARTVIEWSARPRRQTPSRASRSLAPASCYPRARVRSPKCLGRFASASAGPSRVGISTSRGSTSTTRSGGCSSASTTSRCGGRST
ncbi:MAG TPA: NAD-dependent epimerase/dehydratase family protein [Solirubrobacteraceae bacterium]